MRNGIAIPDPEGHLAQRGFVLSPAHEADPAALLRFERDNREHFGRWIPDRGDGYYTFEAVSASLDQAGRWWAAGTDLLHVVTDAAGGVVARANLVDIAGQKASLGYRVGEAHEGRGIATAAVADLLRVARARGIGQVRAETATTNLGSQRVLEKCGFTLVGARRAALELGGGELDAADWLIAL